MSGVTRHVIQGYMSGNGGRLAPAVIAWNERLGTDLMIEKYCDTWEALKEELRNIEYERGKKEEQADSYIAPWLYRGQADSTWNLNTTLERKSCRKWYLPEYGELILSIYPDIKKSTGRRFELPTPEEYRKWAHGRNGMPYFNDPNDEYGTTGSTTRDCLKYLTYLRHHGFTSPLLDWTECPYIAAYFAFEHDKQPDAEHAAIFTYLGWAGSGRSGVGSESSIEPIGSNVGGDTRHFVQKSWYTVAFRKHYSDKFEYYSSHEDAFGNTGGEASTGVGEKQDFLWKFVIPIEERATARRELCERRITKGSLFNADERLLSGLWGKRSEYQNG